MRNGGRVAGLIAALAATGVATGVTAQMVGRQGTGMPWLQTPLALGVLALAGHLVIRVQVRDQVEGMDLFEAVLAPVIVVFPATAAVALAVAAKAIVASRHRLPLVKVAFNAAQWGAAAGSGALVFAALRSGTDLQERNLAALVAAMVTVLVVNYASFVAVVALSGGRSVGAVLAEFRSLIVVGWLGASVVNIAFGVLFVSAYVRSPAAIAVMVVPLVVLHWGSRGFATVRTDQQRMAGLQAATHALARPIDPRDALPGFLAEVQECFEADAVELVEETSHGPVRHRVGGGAAYTSGPDDGLSTATRLAAPVRTGERSFGVLRVYNPGGAEGFEQGEVVVLEALASELAGALVKAELLEGMLDERRRLADIVGNTSDGILTLDEHGVVTSWNAGLERITGYDAASMLGRVPDIVLRPRDEQGTAIELGGWYGGDALPIAIEVVTADRQSRWLSCSYTPVAAREDRGPQLVVMARDVTKAHELEQLKDDFVAVVSHELRTPLSPIKGWALTLLKRGDDLSADQRREGARAILRQADRLEQLILNILEDSRVESDVNTAPVDESVDVVASVAKIVDDLAMLAPERQITVRGGDAPALVVGRAVRIEQILANLVTNAVKYSPRSEPIEVTVERGPGAVLISVTDHGPGIPPESRERVFERFERLTDSPTQTGTGLGLYIARRLATTMGAELVLEPATGGGSTFTLRMKAVRQLAAVV